MEERESHKGGKHLRERQTEKYFDRVRDGAEEIGLFLKELEEGGMLFRNDSQSGG